MADTPIEVPTGTLALTGFAVGFQVDVPTGVMTLAGQGVTLKLPITVTDTLRNLDSAIPGWSFLINDALNYLESPASFLFLPGTVSNFASTPDAAALDITGNLDLRCDVALDNWLSLNFDAFVAKWVTLGEQQSFGFDLSNDNGLLRFFHSTNGTDTLIISSTIAPGFVNGSKHGIRVTVDVDNGASGYDVKFFFEDPIGVVITADGRKWTQLGDTVTTSGVTSIFNSISSLEVGSIANGALNLATGKFYRAQVLDDIDGTVVFDADFTSLNPGITSFTESSVEAATVTINQSGDPRAEIQGEFRIIVNLIVPLLDQLFFSDSDLVGGTYGTILEEILDILDFPLAIKRFVDTIAESLNYSETVTDLHKKIAVILDILSIKENILNTGTFGHFLADDLNLLDSLEKIFRELVSEAFNLSDVLTERAIFLSLLSENFNVSDVVAEIFSASTIVTDTFQGTDSAGNQITFFVLSNDKIILRSEIIVSGHAFACWVLTTKEYNPSIYSNFDFNSYAVNNKKLYGARQDGIYLLEGADDSGSDVHTGLLFDFANMDIPATKRLRSVHLGSKTKETTVQVSTDRNISKTYRTKQQRTVIGKEVRGKFWTIAVEDVNNLKSMELNVVLISKTR